MAKKLDVYKLILRHDFKDRDWNKAEAEFAKLEGSTGKHYFKLTIFPKRNFE